MKKAKRISEIIVLIFDLIFVVLFIKNNLKEIKMFDFNKNFDLILVIIGIIATLFVFAYWRIKDYLKEQEKYKLFVSAYTKLLSAYIIDAKIKIDPSILKKEDFTIEEMKLLGFSDSFIATVLNSVPFNPILDVHK